MSVDTKDLMDKVVGNSRYKTIRYLAGGAYGSLYLAAHQTTGQQVAVKFELKNGSEPQLPLEYYFYKMLGNNIGIPKIYYFGECGEYHGLVMQLLGPSLEAMHEKCDNKFSIKTTVLLAIQLIDVFEYVHGKRIIFRDVKPENFLLGQPNTDKAFIVHIIDFGLAKEYISEDGKHIEYRTDKGLTGTARYMSCNTHQHKEQSRRDDLEAVGHLIIYLAKGELPWQGLKIKDTRQRYNQIGKIKRQTKVDVLCKPLPKPFEQYISYVRQLEFKDTPNYQFLKGLFTKLKSTLKGPPNQYDWDQNHHIIKRSVM